MKAILCDRCGQFAKIRGTFDADMYLSVRDRAGRSKEVDICPKCAKAFDEWFAAGSEKPETNEPENTEPTVDPENTEEPVVEEPNTGE